MRKILEISPDHADALNYIGYTYAEQGIRLNVDPCCHAIVITLKAMVALRQLSGQQPGVLNKGSIS